MNEKELKFIFDALCLFKICKNTDNRDEVINKLDKHMKTYRHMELIIDTLRRMATHLDE